MPNLGQSMPISGSLRHSFSNLRPMLGGSRHELDLFEHILRFFMPDLGHLGPK